MINLDDLKTKITAPSTKVSRRGSINGDKNIRVLTNKSGCRMSISYKLFEELGSPKELEIAFLKDERQVILSNGNGIGSCYRVSTSKEPIIYNVALVKDFNATFEMDKLYCSEGADKCTTLNFSNINIDKEQKIAIVSIPTAEEYNG